MAAEAQTRSLVQRENKLGYSKRLKCWYGLLIKGYSGNPWQTNFGSRTDASPRSVPFQ